MEKERRADEKYSHGMKVLGKSDDGKKRSRDYFSDDESSDESDDEVLSVAYRKENKIPEDIPSEVSVVSSSSASSKRRKASPPKQSHIMSKEEIKKMYPNMCLDDEDDCLDVDSTYPEKVSDQLTTDLSHFSSVMK